MWKKWILHSIISLMLATITLASTPISERPIVQLQTSFGDIIIRLFPDEAPETCSNFLDYVKDGFYDNTLIHRVIDGFIIQAGGFTKDYIPKPTKKPIHNESRGGLSNTRGTISMALTTDKNSATSQFFINLADNTDLNYTTSKGRGYTVFAEVIKGLEVVDKIKKVRTRRLIIYSELYKRNVPLYDVPEFDIELKKVIILRN